MLSLINTPRRAVLISFNPCISLYFHFWQDINTFVCVYGHSFTAQPGNVAVPSCSKGKQCQRSLLLALRVKVDRKDGSVRVVNVIEERQHHDRSGKYRTIIKERCYLIF